MKYTIGVVDDHQLFLKSLTLMVNSFPSFTVVMEALSGRQLQELMFNSDLQPDILLLDVNIPDMDGIEIAKWVFEHFPWVKMAALSMNDADYAIAGMVDAGCDSYLLKNTHPNDFEIALLEIAEKGFYNGDSELINFRRLLKTKKEEVVLTPKEKLFLPYVCSDMGYRQIAGLLGVSEATIENYRRSLFTRFEVQSRTGLAMEALRRGLVNL